MSRLIAMEVEITRTLRYYRVVEDGVTLGQEVRSSERSFYDGDGPTGCDVDWDLKINTVAPMPIPERARKRIEAARVVRFLMLMVNPNPRWPTAEHMLWELHHDVVGDGYSYPNLIEQDAPYRIEVNRFLDWTLGSAPWRWKALVYLNGAEITDAAHEVSGESMEEVINRAAAWADSRLEPEEVDA